jgi:hypothetical protein
MPWSPKLPKYFKYKVAGYYLYFTSSRVVEAMHAHASDRSLTEAGSAKFWVRMDGSTEVADVGNLTARETRLIREFIAENYVEMYELWSSMSNEGFYRQ